MKDDLTIKNPDEYSSFGKYTKINKDSIESKEVEKYYNESGSANHYNAHRINCFHQQEAIWGSFALMQHYEMQIFEYKFRIGKKNDSVKQELLKINWLETAIEYLKEKIMAGQGIDGYTDMSHPLPQKFLDMLAKSKI